MNRCSLPAEQPGGPGCDRDSAHGHDRARQATWETGGGLTESRHPHILIERHQEWRARRSARPATGGGTTPRCLAYRTAPCDPGAMWRGPTAAQTASLRTALRGALRCRPFTGHRSCASTSGNTPAATPYAGPDTGGAICAARPPIPTRRTSPSRRRCSACTAGTSPRRRPERQRVRLHPQHVGHRVRRAEAGPCRLLLRIGLRPGAARIALMRAKSPAWLRGGMQLVRTARRALPSWARWPGWQSSQDSRFSSRANCLRRLPRY